MKVATPHYLLFSESRRKSSLGEWRFLLQSLDDQRQFEAADTEPDVKGERLELLAVVRGLEALDQPSRVTLVTPSRYVHRGLEYGLAEWRANDWQWELFGEMVPVKNRDLWQRVDQALRYHELECRTWRFDLPHFAVGQPAEEMTHDESVRPRRARRALWVRLRRLRLVARRRLADRMAAILAWPGQCGTRLFPVPWLE